MPMYMKKSAAATATSETMDDATRARVKEMLAAISSGGEEAAIQYSRDLDCWKGTEVVVSDEEVEHACLLVPDRLKKDIVYAHANIKRFAEAQKASIQDFEVEVTPGLIAGQRQIPVGTAGCYVPGGRYSHVASAIMTITTAKVAGVGHVTACSTPSRSTSKIPPAILFAMRTSGADRILAIGGVQGIAAMASGMFGAPPADVLAGPGNQFVAEAKRALFGQCGIDMFAGPTDSMVIADSTAQAELVAIDLIGQAEHGYNSPVWLVTTDRKLAERVIALAPKLIESLPEVNRESARAAWRDHGEVLLCDSAEEMARFADLTAPEHLHVQAADLDWWLHRLTAYGSLFLGEETTVPFGDKVSGPNHVLPTSRAARYTGGLSVHKFQKTVTWQRCTREGSVPLAEAAARISRAEGMEGHARSAEIRLTHFFPGRTFDVANPLLQALSGEEVESMQ